MSRWVGSAGRLVVCWDHVCQSVKPGCQTGHGGPISRWLGARRRLISRRNDARCVHDWSVHSWPVGSRRVGGPPVYTLNVEERLIVGRLLGLRGRHLRGWWDSNQRCTSRLVNYYWCAKHGSQLGHARQVSSRLGGRRRAIGRRVHDRRGSSLRVGDGGVCGRNIRGGFVDVRNVGGRLVVSHLGQLSGARVRAKRVRDRLLGVRNVGRWLICVRNVRDWRFSRPHDGSGCDLRLRAKHGRQPSHA